MYIWDNVYVLASNESAYTRPEHINWFFFSCCSCWFSVIRLCVVFYSICILLCPISLSICLSRFCSFIRIFLLLFWWVCVCVFCAFGCSLTLSEDYSHYFWLSIFLSLFFICRWTVTMISSVWSQPCAHWFWQTVQYNASMEWNVMKHVSKFYVAYIKWLTQAKKNMR